jgi:phosphoribosylanthranilate isomerase
LAADALQPFVLRTLCCACDDVGSHGILRFAQDDRVLEMTWVKICGMTNLEDALVAVDAGADAVGFVFYEKSPRCVTVEKAREIVEKLPKQVEKVGVFAGESLLRALEKVLFVGFDSIQEYPMTRLGFDEDSGSKAAEVNGLKVYWAFPIAMFLGEGAKNISGFLPQQPTPRLSMMISDPQPPPQLPIRLVLDSGGSQQPGGTGQAFDWQEAKNSVKELSRGWKVVVAGGLRPDNVGKAIDILHPWGVDVVSGVEASPGKKDSEKVRTFVRAVREMDRRVG